MFKVIVSHRSSVCTLAAALLVTGCVSLNPPPPVEMPSTAPPVLQPRPTAQQTPATGSLFNAGRYRPMFEDQRARMVGDSVTVNIVERVSASQSTDSKVGRANELSTGVTSLPLLRGGAEKTIADALTLGAESKNDFKGSGATSSNNTFTGSIATTVVDVLPNGHLVIAGEKQIGVNHNVDVLRFTGTVDPRSLRPGSTVASTQVANLRVESRSRGQAGEAQSIGWLSRFFLNVMPF